MLYMELKAFFPSSIFRWSSIWGRIVHFCCADSTNLPVLQTEQYPFPPTGKQQFRLWVSLRITVWTAVGVHDWIGRYTKGCHPNFLSLTLLCARENSCDWLLTLRVSDGWSEWEWRVDWPSFKKQVHFSLVHVNVTKFKVLAWCTCVQQQHCKGDTYCRIYFLLNEILASAIISTLPYWLCTVSVLNCYFKV